jgi:NAD(P)-dependent dehydrogenase (short-subunit alcohol dehydrogenase family)
MSDRVVLVTGATDGLGKAVATESARAGDTVLIHGRSEERLEATLTELRELTGNDRLRPYRADFASLADVRSMGAQIVEGEDRVDVLVNNAGIGTNLPGDGERLVSQDGFELRFAVNYLAHFLLTGLLKELVVASAPARIVNVSSAGQMPIDFDDVMLEHGYSGVRAYCQSKLAQIMLTFDLADELAGRNVTANALHPATYMPTKMVIAAGATPVSSLEEGTRATMRLVSAPQLDGISGRYWNGEREADADAQAYDEEARSRLRRLSSELTRPVPIPEGPGLEA